MYVFICRSNFHAEVMLCLLITGAEGFKDHFSLLSQTAFMSNSIFCNYYDVLRSVSVFFIII